MAATSQGRITEGREEFIRFQRLVGRRVLVTSNDCLWMRSGPAGSYVRFPIHLDRPLDLRERASLFVRGAIALTYSRPREGAPAAGDSILLLDDPEFGLNHLTKKNRSEAKRGLRDCEVRRVPVDELAPVGHGIMRDNRRRTGQAPPSEASFRRWCNAVRQTSDIWRIWGAFREGELVAYQTVYVVGGVASTEAGYALGDYLRYRPNNALWYVMLKESMADPAVDIFVEGYYPVRVRPSIGRFKESVGLRRVSVRRELRLNPLLWPFVNSLGHGLCRRMAARDPSNRFWQRAVLAQERLLGTVEPPAPDDTT